MKVSICCSVLNQSAWLSDMIASVVAQTFEDWELIIVDDGSTEDIPAVIAQFSDEKNRVRYHRFTENRGIPHGINWAFREAKGDYIQALAADEILHPSKLQLQVEYLDSHPQKHGVWGLPQNGHMGERPSWEQHALKASNRNRAQWIATLLNLDHVPLGSCSALFRREVFDKIGYFDEALKMFVDHEWFVRFFENFDGHVMCHRLAVSRPNPKAISAPTEENLKKAAAELQIVRGKHPALPSKTNGKVTVCIPVFNMERHVLQAVDSVLAQSHSNLELIVVDDCSTDETLEVLKNHARKKQDSRLTIIGCSANHGDRRACAKALEMATGDYFTVLSADDLIEPDYLAKCVEILEMNPILEFVASQTDFIDNEGKPYQADHPFKAIEKASNKSIEQWKERLYYGNVYFGVGTYRTQALRDIGGWKQEYGCISDYAVYLALLQRGPIYVIEENLTHTRITGSNRSMNINAAWLKKTYSDIKREFYAPRMKVIIATPFYESRGYSPYISALSHTIRLLTQAGIEHEFWELSGDAYVDRAKNTIVNRFMEDPDNTDLFMIDSDMYWNADAVLTMLQLPEEIVVGSYLTKNAWEKWTSSPEVEIDENGKPYTIGRKLPDGSALIEGRDLAGGFMRIRRGALEKYRRHFTDLTYTDIGADPLNPQRVYTEFFACDRHDGVRWGEDRVFCRRLKEMGLKWYIYPNITIGHYGIREHLGNFDTYLKGIKASEEHERSASD